MTRVVYVNGRISPTREAGVHAEDRGFQFGDAVYEVCEVSGGRLVDETRHMQRLARSLGELASRSPCRRAPGRASCARRSGATACATASSTCRCRAARAPARLPVPASLT